MTHRCFSCGAAAFISYGQAGRMRDRTSDKRLWTCAAHEAEAKARRDAHFGYSRPGAASAPACAKGAVASAPAEDRA